MAGQMIDTDEWKAGCSGQSFGRHHSRHDATDQPGACGYCDTIDLVQRNLGGLQGLCDNQIELFSMGSCGNFRNNAAKGGMKRVLPEHNVRQNLSPAQNGCGGVVTTAFDAEDGQCHVVGALRGGPGQVTLRGLANNAGPQADMRPILVLTRLPEDSERFAEAVKEAFDPDLRVVLSPAFEIRAITPDVIPEAADLIATSRHGVAQITRLGLKARTVWCVGKRTAEAAKAAGYAARSADGDAEALINLILDERPEGPLLHVAGRDRRGDIADRLSDAGIACKVITAYAQVPRAPSKELQDVARGTTPVITPVFSPKTAMVFAGLAWHGRWHGVAMSDAVAAVLTDLGCDTVETADAPTEVAMRDVTLAALVRLSDRPI